jgi:hypothetical protein
VTGRQVFSFPDGAFNPVIADYHAIYLDGYNTIYQLLPPGPAKHRAAHPKPAAAPRRAAHAARHKARQTRRNTRRAERKSARAKHG